jgi:hypothetical protein
MIMKKGGENEKERKEIIVRVMGEVVVEVQEVMDLVVQCPLSIMMIPMGILKEGQGLSLMVDTNSSKM